MLHASIRKPGVYVSPRHRRAKKRHLLKVVHHDANEQVHDEVRPEEHEQDEEPNPDQVLVPDRLHVLRRRVYGGVRNRRPGLSRRNLEECQEGHRDVVELLGDGLVPIQAEALANLQTRRQKPPDKSPPKKKRKQVRGVFPCDGRKPDNLSRAPCTYSFIFSGVGF